MRSTFAKLSANHYNPEDNVVGSFETRMTIAAIITFFFQFFRGYTYIHRYIYTYIISLDVQGSKEMKEINYEQNEKTY